MDIRPASHLEIQSAMMAGQPLPLLRLAMDMTSCATEEEMNSNFLSTLNRGYQPINDYLGKFSGTASLVGSGPSIKKTYQDLKGDVFAINSSIGFLLDHGVIPKWALLWDAADIVEKFAIPHPRITYLVASRCHPKVFERLKDCKVIVWHAGGDHNILQMLQKPEVIEKQKIQEPLINGGSAGVTRGLYIVHALGYDDINIFGGDSSYSPEGETHVRGSIVREKDFMVSIGNNPPLWFRTTPEWCAQVEEYRIIYSIFKCRDLAKIEVHGDGMLKTMHDLLKAKYDLLGKEEFMNSMVSQELERQEMNEKVSNAPPGSIPIIEPVYHNPTT